MYNAQARSWDVRGNRVGNWIQLRPTLITNGGTYTPKGTRIKNSGRITTIVIHPSDVNTIFIAAAQGGVWKIKNGGRTWGPTSDNMLSLAIGALAIDETNPSILYAGTGEGNFALNSQYGIGNLKTNDLAETWKLDGENVFINSRF